MAYRTWGRLCAGFVIVLAALGSACGSDDESDGDGGAGGTITGTTTGTTTGSPSGTPTATPTGTGVGSGGPCTYLHAPGECTITVVEDYPPDTTRLQVSFLYVADDPTVFDTSWYAYDENEVHTGLLSPKDCATQYGITEQSTHSCVLHVIETGTCTPAMFELTELGAECEWL